MTLEQVQLLATKCGKQDVQQADHMVMAIQSVLGSIFGGKRLLPSDIMDMRLGYELDENGNQVIVEDGEPEELTPRQRRERMYGKWNMSDGDLIRWLQDKSEKHGGQDYDLKQFFTPEELKAHGIAEEEQHHD